jgi:serine protease Do
VFVQSVQDGSIAAVGGLQAGDILFKIDGRWVRSPEEMVSRLQGYATGDTVRFSVLREGVRKNFSLRLTAAPVVAAPALAVGTPPVNPATLPPAGKTATAAAVPTEFEWNGMELNPIDAAMEAKNPALKGKKGAMVKETDPGLPADAAGVRMNDVVMAINGLPVGSNAQLDQAIKASTTAKTILLDVERDGKRMFVTLK